MAEGRTIEWKGLSGKGYTYWIHPLGTTFADCPGNYVFAREGTPGRFTPIYAGETGDLSERFSDHHKMECIKRNGATHVTAHKSSADDKVRRMEEADIVANYDPVCNG